MNERIRVLAEQADAHACITIGNQWLVWEELTPGWAACRDEKFAELIVKECAHQCVQNEYYNAYSIDSLGATKAAKSFKKYFGVK